jgi:hypothetical protein
MTVVQFPKRGKGVPPPPQPPPPGTPRRRSTITLPTFHPDQVRAFHLPARFRALRCGRRWGKTRFLSTIAADVASKGGEIGWFAPDYRISQESFVEIEDILMPITTVTNRSLGTIKTSTGGRVDVWTLENPRAGRSRHYHGVVIDEAAFAKVKLMDMWDKAIRPTLIDHRGWCIVASNTNGIDPENFFWRICNESKHGFKEYHAPSHSNPYLPPDELEEFERRYHPLVYKQEILADFVDFRGVAFFAIDKLLVNGKPVEWPTICDWVWCTIDTAIKSGQEHDATAVVYWAHYNVPEPHLTILDWDIISIDGALLTSWLPNVFKRLDYFTRQFRVRYGAGKAFIEDKGSGTILLQAAEASGWPVEPIDTELTAKGKDERALAVSTQHQSGLVKISSYAHDKVSMWHGHELNHFLHQVTGFRVGEGKDGTKRADDLADCYMYGLSIGLGNAEGF